MIWGEFRRDRLPSAALPQVNRGFVAQQDFMHAKYFLAQAVLLELVSRA